MTSRKIKILLALPMFLLCCLSSCDDKDLPLTPENIPNSEDGDILTVTITLDNMGGPESRATSASFLTEMENYVDVEKIRILFFDNEDKFLFESKSRWIKQLDPAIDHSIWAVSIPLYSYGNDLAYDWDWDKIKAKLSTESFKIAVLANRPDREWNMGITYKDDPSIVFVKGGWFGSNGPDWTKKNSSVYEGDDGVEKTIFDLHHCQYDPIYHGKNIVNTDLNSPNYHYYDFITKDVEGNPDRPYMGATSSWVDWGENDETGDEGIKNGNRDPHGWFYRKTRLPSKKNPIPMYGIQRYEHIEGWKKGSTIDLTREGDKSISLLRSVVKLELLVPEGYADDVVLFYSNIYARCEPADVWTPTDELWRDANGSHDNICEIERISEYGKMTYFSSDHTFGANATYPQRMSWIYGSWMEQGWDFNGQVDVTRLKTEGNRIEFPRLFNPCVQRNEAVYVDKTYTEGGYDHYVVYTGERNINDPSALDNIDNSGSGNATALYWCIVADTQTDANGKYTQGNTYSLAVIDYENVGNNSDALFYATRVGQLISYTPSGGEENFAPRNSPRAKDTTYTSNSASSNINGSFSNGTGMGNYLKSVQGSANDLDSRYRNNNIVYSSNYDSKYYPLPLVRNHVYKITLTGSASRSGDDFGFTINSQVLATEDINFKR